MSEEGETSNVSIQSIHPNSPTQQQSELSTLQPRSAAVSKAPADTEDTVKISSQPQFGTQQASLGDADHDGDSQ